MLVEEVWEEYKQITILQLKKTSYDSIESKMRLYIIKDWGLIDIKGITTLSIRKWQGQLTLDGISAGQVNSISSVFRRLLNYAIENNYLEKNPFSSLKKIKNSGVISDFNNFWTYEEFKSFIRFVDDLEYAMLFTLLYFTGLRRGEVKALQWTDVFFEEEFINVNKQIVKVKGNARYLSTPKSYKSQRKVYLNTEFKNILFNYYLHEKMIQGFKEDWYIFGRDKSKPDTTLQRKLDYYIKKCDVKRITLHGFRHSHASLLIKLENDILAISSRLGHDDVNQTLDRYSHLYPNALQETALKIDKFLNNENKAEDIPGLLSKIEIVLKEYNMQSTYYSEQELKVINQLTRTLDEIKASIFI